MAEKDAENGEIGIMDDCIGCDNRELCPVYMGQSCLLVQQHFDAICCSESNTE